MGVKLEPDLIDTAGICQNCFIKFNEIDEHQTIAERIQNDLLVMFNSTRVMDTKHDVKLDDSVEVTEVYVHDDEHYSENEQYLQETDDFDDNHDNEQLHNRKRRGPKKKKNLDAGLIMVEVDGLKLYQCDICQKVCKDRYKLKNHKETHSIERNICCTECGAM